MYGFVDMRDFIWGCKNGDAWRIIIGMFKTCSKFSDQNILFYFLLGWCKRDVGLCKATSIVWWWFTMMECTLLVWVLCGNKMECLLTDMFAFYGSLKCLKDFMKDGFKFFMILESNFKTFREYLMRFIDF